MIMLTDEWRRHAGSWAASLALHGVLDGVIVGYAVSSEPAAVALPPRVVPQSVAVLTPLVEASEPIPLNNAQQVKYSYSITFRC